MGDYDIGEQGPVTRATPDVQDEPYEQERCHEWHGRRIGTHEHPGIQDHEIPGTFPVGNYRIYHHDGRWRHDDTPLTRDGGLDLLVTDEWLTYAVDTRESGPHDLTLRVAAADGFGGGVVGIAVDREPQTRVAFEPTGGWDEWAELTTSVELERGFGLIRLVVLEGGWKLDRIRIE
ncbi:carbohydrate-binding protein [Haloarcula marina]|uniref:carbohydrate-binding protein n=1 Tax=Haloarcula marina TaxID=2961574 RepID=UPI0020B89B87|nr:carbohydrate-binding protein [Halomicroarcula marina]